MTDKPPNQRSLKAAAREGAKPPVGLCAWCGPGHPPSPEHHPGGQAEHVPTLTEDIAALAKAAGPIDYDAIEEFRGDGPALVTFRCHHTRPVADFLHGDCAECRNKAMKAKLQRRQEKRAQKPPDQSRRLPHGSVFHKVYGADTQTWTGSLSVPCDDERFLTHPAYFADLGGDSALIFRASASAEKKLEHVLDAMYRECVASVLGGPK